METQKAEKEILDLINRAKIIIPKEYAENLKINALTNQPEWHSFESEIWRIGEDIRQILSKNPKLKNNEKLFECLLEIATNKNAKRGRQSFILLFGSIKQSKHSEKLITQINDEFVSGHIIDTIYKMKTGNYSNEIKPFCNNKFAWIRNTAKKYIKKHEQIG